MQTPLRPLAAVAVLLLTTACATGPRTEPAHTGTLTTLSGLEFQTPVAWTTRTPSSSMRVAEFLVPAGAAEVPLVVYYFGPDSAGSLEANIERWLGQIEPEGGQSARAVASLDRVERNGLVVHHVDVAGTYVAETRPGSGEFLNQPNQRLLAAIVETDAGPYYVKVVGAQEAVARLEPSYRAFLGSMRAGALDATQAGELHP
ncbi:MAG: hypothetical protein HKO59_17950 [Phycisphaerales bacterium]|nr:hypothetical protein [Phycisphaerae bacterium]NNM27824.1 hypothetical protein [Phycisphaerales bacterium]